MEGVILDENGTPLKNATVVIMDWTYTRPVARVYTDEKGVYRLMVVVGRDYKVYAYKDDPSTPGIDYAPGVSPKLYYAVPERSVKVDPIKLVKAATINLTGSIWYVRSGKAATSFRVIVVDPETEKPISIANYINEYGSSEVTWFVNRSWRTLVIVPANRSVDLIVVARVYGEEAMEEVTFKLDNDGKHFMLSQGEYVTYDISKIAFKTDLDIVETAINKGWEIVYKAQSVGFYVAAQQDELKEAQRLLEIARANVERLDFGITTQVVMRKAYEIASKGIIYEIKEMESIALLGAIILPFFLASFAVTMAFFFFEEDKNKMIFSVVFYALILAYFYFVYPGVPLMVERNIAMFVESITVAALIIALITFGIPRIFKEPIGAVKITLRNTLAVAFMIGKRHVKLRKVRSLINILSLLALTAALTTLTTVSSVYGLQSEILGTATGNWIYFKNPGEGAGAFLPIDHHTVFEINEYANATALAPKVESAPSVDPIAVIVSGEKKVNIYGIIGIDPKYEVLFSDLGIPAQDQYGKGTLILSKTLADKLGVGKGDKVTLELYVHGIRMFFGEFKVAAVADDLKLVDIKEADGSSFLPRRYVRDEKGNLKLEICKPYEVVILWWEDALVAAESPYEMNLAISRVYVMAQDPSKSGDIALSITWARGLQAWVVVDGKLIHYFMGTRTEVTGTEIVVPAAIVATTIAVTMYSVVEERRREIFIYAAIGFNPTHIALVFIAEAITTALVGSGLGYLAGLGLYRAMAAVASSYYVGVRENLHWWMSVISILAGLAVTVPSTMQPAIKAAMMTIPSKVRKVKVVSEKERVKRKERIFRAYVERTLPLAVKVKRDEIVHFIGYLYDSLDAYRAGFTERIENLEDLGEVELPDGRLERRIRFDHVMMRGDKALGTVNEIILELSPGSKHYTIRIASRPKEKGIPESVRERALNLIKGIILNWEKRRKEYVR